MGDKLAMVAFPFLIYGRTGSAFGTGIILALYTLPYVLFGTFAGVVIDRFNKRILMVAADVVRAVLMALVPLAAVWSLPSVYVLAFLVASVTVFFEPTKLAVLPEIVPRDRLLRANSLLVTGDNLSEIFGYSLAGLVVALVSVTHVFQIDAATFLVSACALILMRYEAPVRTVRDGVRSVRSEIREGMDYLRSHRGLRINTVIVLAVVAGVGAAWPLTFFLAVEVMSGDSMLARLTFLSSGAVQNGIPATSTIAFGLFEAAIGAGSLLGSIGLALLARRIRKGFAMTVGLAVMGIALIVVAAADSVWTAILPFLVFGLANAAVLIAVDTYVQEVVPEELLGRVWGARFTLTQGTFALGVLSAGALASAFDVRLLLIAAGLVISVPGIAALFLSEVRDA
jgi:MFS family permease